MTVSDIINTLGRNACDISIIIIAIGLAISWARCKEKDDE